MEMEEVSAIQPPLEVYGLLSRSRRLSYSGCRPAAAQQQWTEHQQQNIKIIVTDLQVALFPPRSWNQQHQTCAGEQSSRHAEFCGASFLVGYGIVSSRTPKGPQQRSRPQKKRHPAPWGMCLERARWRRVQTTQRPQRGAVGPPNVQHTADAAESLSYPPWCCSATHVGGPLIYKFRTSVTCRRNRRLALPATENEPDGSVAAGPSTV